MSVAKVDKQISKTLKNSDMWMCFLRICIIVLILAIIYCVYLAIEQDSFNWLKILLVPLLVVVIKAHSDENQANIKLISALNQTQIIANDQDEILRRIRTEEIANKEKGG